MRATFHGQLDELESDILKMGTMVEEAIGRAVRSLVERDTAAAEAVIQGDDLIDQLEMEIEKRCLTLLALQQPMASDLRLIGTALKIVTDLERMADHAVNIAKVTIELDGQPLIKPLIDIPRMAEKAEEMTRQALTAFVRRDVELARRMIEGDDLVDHLYNQIFRELLLIMIEDPSTIQQATSLLFVAQYLERIADHATNLGEWIIYMVTGEREDLND